jgi:hypothetical protein
VYYVVSATPGSVIYKTIQPSYGLHSTT